MRSINLLHALLLGPALIYVGLMPDAVNEKIYTAMLVGGIVIMAYHAWRAYNKLKEDQSAWVNWIHIFLVAPLFIIIGYLKKDASRRYFEMLLMMGIAATGYHGIYLIRDMLAA